MIRRSPLNTAYFRKGSTMFLAFCWTTGLLLGGFVSVPADASFVLLMRSAVSAPVSIVGLLSVLLFPFFLSVYLARAFGSWILYPIAFTKALVFGFSQSLICSVFTGAGWLFYFFLMFSQIMVIPSLLFFWISCLDPSRLYGRRLVYCLGYCVFVALADWQVIGPYLSGLIS